MCRALQRWTETLTQPQKRLSAAPLPPGTSGAPRQPADHRTVLPSSTPHGSDSRRMQASKGQSRLDEEVSLKRGALEEGTVA